MSSKIQSRPQLRQASVKRRVDSLFKAMSTDFLLREQFVTEPSQVLSEYVHASKLDPEQAEASDHLIYSVMSNQPLLSWLRDYSIKQGGVVPPRAKLMSDFSRAIVANGGHHVVIALAKSSVEKQDVLSVFEAFLPILFGTFAGGRVAQTEMSTGHTTGTEMSTGHIAAGLAGIRAQTEMSTGHTTGTEMSTGHIVAQPGSLRAQTEMSTGHTTGTEMSTGHFVAQLGNIFRDMLGRVAQTEMSTGHTTGTEMSTGHIVAQPGSLRAQTEMSTGHTTGTEMSTGHIVAQPGNVFKDVAGRMAQTEMSTGHTTGTEMSTGHIVAQPGSLRAQTEMSTGHTTGTEMSTGHFTDVGGLRAQTEMSTGHTTGTEMSTGHIAGDLGGIRMSTESSGTGTMMSTGHTTGTMISTGHILGSEVFQVGFERITLAALVDHAIELRNMGALDVV